MEKIINPKLLSLLYEVQYKLTVADFYSIFGNEQQHLWLIFASRFNHNLLEFFNHLDKENKHQLLNHIQQSIRLDSE